MSASIYKEISITPNVFKKNALLADERKFERLLNLLDSLAENGQVVLPFGDWFNYISIYLSEFDEHEKDDLEEVLKYLENRQRIVFATLDKSQDNERIWIERCVAIQKFRNLNLLLSIYNEQGLKTIDDLDRELLRSLQNRGATIQPQSRQNMQTILTPILAYAEIVKIYDPYFKISEKRYEDALEIIATALGSKHGKQETGIIEIHTSVKSVLNRENMIDLKIINDMVEKISYFEAEYKHAISLNIWEESSQNKWHDRWLITNQCGVTLGKGVDISNWTDSTWGMLDYNQIPNVERKFSSNRDEFVQIGVIENKIFAKKNASSHYRLASSVNTEEERMKKLKNVKCFKK